MTNNSYVGLLAILDTHLRVAILLNYQSFKQGSWNRELKGDKQERQLQPAIILSEAVLAPGVKISHAFNE